MISTSTRRNNKEWWTTLLFGGCVPTLSMCWLGLRSCRIWPLRSAFYRRELPVPDPAAQDPRSHVWHGNVHTLLPMMMMMMMSLCCEAYDRCDDDRIAGCNVMMIDSLALENQRTVAERLGSSIVSRSKETPAVSCHFGTPERHHEASPSSCVANLSSTLFWRISSARRQSLFPSTV